MGGGITFLPKEVMSMLVKSSLQYNPRESLEAIE